MAQPNLIIKKPSGGINTDTNPNDIPPQSMLGALDITDINHGELNEDGFTQLNNNTELAFDICGTQVQMLAKNYRLKFDIPDSAFTIVFKIIHRVNTWNVVITTPSITSSDPEIVYSDIDNEFQSNYDNLYDDFFHTFSNIIDGGSYLQFDLLFDNFRFDDYFVEVSIVKTDDNTITYPYDLFVLNDSISLDKEGYLKPIEIVSLG